jgi:hypothetical protein
MREKPLVVPNRSRKLLPRLVMVAPDETVELMTVGFGTGEGAGDGDGVGVGVDVGVGVGVAVAVDVGVGDCACAGVITPIASTKAIEANRTSTRPATAPSTRDEQRMNFIPEKSARSKIAESRSTGPDLRLVHAERQSVTVVTKD